MVLSRTCKNNWDGHCNKEVECEEYEMNTRISLQVFCKPERVVKKYNIN